MRTLISHLTHFEINRHATAVTDDGRVWSWGLNSQGTLGLGDTENRWSPTLVQPLAAAVRMVSCGGFFTLALTEQGTVYAWGQGVFGVLAQGDEENRPDPTPIDLERIGGAKVGFVSAGAHHALAITSSGELYSWGDGSHGQLGLGHR